MELLTSVRPPVALLLAASCLGAVVLGISSLLRFVRRRKFIRLHGCQPVNKYPNRDPFFGTDFTLDTIRNVRVHKVLERGLERFQKYGKTFVAKEIGREGITTIEPENIKTVMSLNFKDYTLGHRIKEFGPLLGAGIFDTDGEHWAASRALIRPNFTRDQVADLTMFEKLIQDLFALLPRDSETVVDLQSLFFRYTLDSATEFLFGQSVGSLKEPDAASLALGLVDSKSVERTMTYGYAFDYAQKAIIMRAILGPFQMFYRDKEADRCNKFCRDFAQQFVDEAVHTVEERARQQKAGQSDAAPEKYVFLHELASRTTDKRRLLDELMNVLLAGRDTTGGLLSNLFFMLAKEPAMWEKLRQEVATLNGRLPTYEDLRELKYVQCCLNESLRLHPLVPRNQRVAERDTVLPVGGGKDGRSPVFVPKGNFVRWSVYAMHRDKEVFGPDADDFRPERWENGQLKPKWEYLPFNGGPRICLGQRYALTEAGYVVVRMVQKFQTLKSRDPEPWVESLGLTICSHNGTKVSLTAAT